jgi:hypothetical protein
MPIVRKLNPQEVQTLERKGKGQRRLVEEQYDAFLADYDVGDESEAELEENEKRLIVRNRFKAATRRGLDLAFQRTQGNVLRFRIGPATTAETAPEVEAVEPVPPAASQPAPKLRSGRKKAAAAPAR